MALTEAQKKAQNKWRAKNREKLKIQNYKTHAKTYIRNYATLDELEDFKILINERARQIKGLS